MHSFYLSADFTDHLLSARHSACLLRTFTLRPVALEAVILFKQALTGQDCALEGPVCCKVARLESK